MYRSLRLAVIGSLILTPCFSLGAEKLPYVELEAPRFDGGQLDNQILPSLNTRFSAFNSTGTLVAATCGSQVFVWKVPSGELLWRTQLPMLENPGVFGDKVAWVANPGHQVSFSPKGGWLAVSSCYSSSNVYFWKLATIASEPDRKDPIVLSSADFAEATPRGWNAAPVYPSLYWQSEESAVIYTRGNLYYLQISDSLRLHPYVSVHPSHWQEVAIDPGNGSRLNMIGVTLTPDQTGSLLTVFHNREVVPRVDAAGPPQFTPLAYVTASRDWLHFAGVSRDLKMLGIFDFRSGRTRILEESVPHWSTHVAWSSDGRVLAAGRNSDPKKVSQGRAVALAATSRDAFHAAFYQAQAPTLVLWETTTAKILSSTPAGTFVAGNGDACNIGAFSPDDRYLLTHVPRHGTPSRPGCFQLWDINSVLQELRNTQ